MQVTGCCLCRKSDALGRLLACMPMQQLRALRVTATGLMAADTAVLATAKQLTSLDLSCNPCLSEACMQHLHGEHKKGRPTPSPHLLCRSLKVQGEAPHGRSRATRRE